MTSTTRTIFISIIAYRDPECQYTIQSIYTQAKYPERVYVGICWQYEPNIQVVVKDGVTHTINDSHDLFHSFNLNSYPPNHITQLYLHARHARGPCYARSLVQQHLYNNQEIYMQIDSHMRMIRGWDVDVVEMYDKCCKIAGHECVVLTSYPPPYHRNKPTPTNREPLLLCATQFHPTDHMLRITGRTLSCIQSQPISTLFVAAGMMWTHGHVVKRCPYDPTLDYLFFGEEISYSARLFTHGYDFYAPSHVTCYHLWERDYRPWFKSSLTEQQRQAGERAKHVVYNMLGIPPPTSNNTEPNTSISSTSSTSTSTSPSPSPSPPTSASTSSSSSDSLHSIGAVYGLGTVRPLSAYESYAGITFSTLTVTQHARDGGVSPSLFAVDKLAAIMALMQRIQGPGPAKT